ncbi:MAG TPA: hypothetical protein VM097_02355 [Mycobacteriales bacterium]|nr:hypothetical protein [Mycobacteriales bacterium]
MLPPSHYLELKDPCVAHDGERWHLFGTGVARRRFEVFHATSLRLAGPWSWELPVDVSALRGSCVAAPGVVHDEGRWHLFLQTTFNELGGVLEHLVSDDGAVTFAHARTALTSLPGTDEAGLYDPHPCVIDGEKLLVYSAFSIIGQPDVHAVRSLSGSWDGPWERLGAVLRHEDVHCHNQRGAPGYEWGLEAAQVLELEDGRCVMNAVCFLPGQAQGARQRVFLAAADSVEGPWEVIGPVVTPAPGGGENGHGCLVEEDGSLFLLHQERSLQEPRWGLSLTELDLCVLTHAVDEEDVA